MILSELLSNAWRHGRPWRSDPGGNTVRAAWCVGEDDRLTVEVTDGGGPTRPLPAKPSVTARGGRGLNIIMSLAEDWGVRDDTGDVTVWALLPTDSGFTRRVTIPPDLGSGLKSDLESGLSPDLAPELGTEPRSNLDTNIDPDFDRELDFADLDELA